MSRRAVIRAILSGVIMLYIFIMVPLTNRAERNDVFNGLEIKINDPSGIGFLTVADVDAALGDISSKIDTLHRRNLNTLEVEKRLGDFNRVEKATCRILNNGTLVITVDPFDPVARVFDPEGSVYVNTAGKRVPANPAYHVDVPVVTTDVTADSGTVALLLPLLRKIKTDSGANALVSSMRIDRRGDIIIIPNVLGHVINFGDTTYIDNKFNRLRAFYRDVMPVRGWNAYDTVSVKWSGRIVATKRDKSVNTHRILDGLDEYVDDVLDDEIMLVDPADASRPDTTAQNSTKP